MTEKEGGSWKSRKQAIKDKYYATLKTIASGGEPASTLESPGDAATQAVSLLDPSAWGVEPASPSSGTSATATALIETPSATPVSTTPVESTSSSSAPSMAWMVAPIGFVERATNPSMLVRNGLLLPGLEQAAQESLLRLAAGRNEPVEATIQQIAEFFVESEDDRAEGSLKDAIEFYLRNYAP